MPDQKPEPKQEEERAAPPDGDLDDKNLEKVSGGFNPCPEPPGRLRPGNPLPSFNIKIGTGHG